MQKSLVELLSEIQGQLKAPKGQRNNFGNYNYRSCEDITEAAKPLLQERNCILLLSDEIIQVADRIYVKATATIKNKTDEIKVTAQAREPQNKKGMDEAQITGATSSYARKYALNGLFAIDDTKDADTNEHYQQNNQQPQRQKQPQKELVNTNKKIIYEVFKKFSLTNEQIKEFILVIETKNQNWLNFYVNKLPQLEMEVKEFLQVKEMNSQNAKNNLG